MFESLEITFVRRTANGTHNDNVFATNDSENPHTTTEQRARFQVRLELNDWPRVDWLGGISSLTDWAE